MKTVFVSSKQEDELIFPQATVMDVVGRMRREYRTH